MGLPAADKIDNPRKFSMTAKVAVATARANAVIADYTLRTQSQAAFKTVPAFKDMSEDEAASHVRAIAAKEGCTIEQALEKLKNSKDPAKLLKDTYKAEKGPNGKPVANKALKLEIDRINKLPPKDRALAIRSLAKKTGIDIKDLNQVQRDVYKEAKVVANIAKIQDLPPEKQEQARLDIAKELGIVPKDATTQDIKRAFRINHGPQIGGIVRADDGLDRHLMKSWVGEAGATVTIGKAS